MLSSRAGSGITVTVAVIALLAGAALAPSGHVLAQEGEPTRAAQAERVVVSSERFPWWHVLTGIATAGLAGAALYAAFVSLRQYLEQRRRQTALDLAQLHGDLVVLLRQEHERATGTADEELRREELEKAEDVYEGILRGTILVRAELMRAAVKAVQAYLDVARAELDSLRRARE